MGNRIVCLLFLGCSDFLLYSLLGNPDRVTQGLMNVTVGNCECFAKHELDSWLIPQSLCYRNCRICQSAMAAFPNSAQSITCSVVLRLFFRNTNISYEACQMTVHEEYIYQQDTCGYEVSYHIPLWNMGERNRHLLKPYDDKWEILQLPRPYF